MEKWLYVFRIRCEYLEQSDMFATPRTPSDVIRDAFEAHPAAEIGGGSEWHIAAVEKFAESALSFQIGRISAIKNPQYDGKGQRFYDAEGERAPYANGVFDGETQVCVIEKKSSLTSKANEISSKLQKLLNSSKFSAESGFRIVVDELRDPENFIDQIRRSDRVTRFQFIAEFDNAHDVYNLIHRPAEKYNQLIGGASTTVETRGDYLDKDVVEEVARSAASLGDPASATIREVGESKPKRIYLRGTPLLERLSLSGDLEDMQKGMLEALRRAYNRLRRPKDD